MTTYEKKNDFRNSILFFSGSWCPGCKMLKSRIEKLENENEFKKNIVYMDVSENSEIAQRYSILSIPTVMVLEDENPVDVFNIHNFNDEKFLKLANC